MPVGVLDQSVGGLAEELRSRRVTAGIVAEAVIERHAALEPQLNAYRSFDAGLLRRQAAAADALFAAGTDLGPFQGLPVSVKDLYGLAGFRTWAGTPKPLPAAYEREGPVVGAFRRQAALLAGKTHTVEFAFGGSGTNRHHRAPRNPWGATRDRGGGGGGAGG